MRKRSALLKLTIVLTFSSLCTAQTQPATRPAIARSDAFFGLHFDLHPNDGDKSLGADAEEANVAALLDRVKPDYVQYDCKGHVGWLGYPSSTAGPSVPGIIKDSLAIWRKVTAERGVALLIHFSGIWDIQATKAHPEWAVVQANGKTDPNATSVFGPYVDQRMIPELVEAITRYHLDGAWVDGECWAARLDYSPAALARWTHETQLTDAPRKKGDPHWEEWKAFQRRHMEQYVSHWVDEVHKACPWAQVTSNWMYTTFYPQPILAKLDFLSGDYDPNMSVERARIEARYLASTGAPWDLMAWGFTSHVLDMEHNPKPPLHLQQEAAVVLMEGGGFQIYNQPTRSGHVSDTIIRTAGQVADFCRARQAVSHHSKSVPQVAVIMSTRQMCSDSDSVGTIGSGTTNQMIGAMHAMLELHYSVDVLAEHQISGHVKDYPLVVVPDWEILEPKLRDEIVQCVENGGHLLAIGANGAKHFEKILGVNFQDKPQRVSAYVATSAGVTCCNGLWQKVSLTSAEALGYRYPIDDTRKNGEIAATVATCGKGRVAAIFGPADLRFYHAHHPWLREFIGKAAQAAWTEPAVTIDAPPCVDVSLRRAKDGRLTVHLLNRANQPQSNTYGTIDFIPPIGPIDAHVRLAAKPQRVEWIPGEAAVPWTWANGILTATIPPFELHGVLAITE